MQRALPPPAGQSIGLQALCSPSVELSLARVFLGLKTYLHLAWVFSNQKGKHRSQLREATRKQLGKMLPDPLSHSPCGYQINKSFQ